MMLFGALGSQKPTRRRIGTLGPKSPWNSTDGGEAAPQRTEVAAPISIDHVCICRRHAFTCSWTVDSNASI